MRFQQKNGKGYEYSQHCTKKEIPKDYKHIKRHSISLMSKEVQIKTEERLFHNRMTDKSLMSDIPPISKDSAKSN